MTAPLPADQVDAHDPEGAALFLEERARVSAHIATIPYKDWPRSADVQKHFAFRFTQIAGLIRELRAERVSWVGVAHDHSERLKAVSLERDLAVQDVVRLQHAWETVYAQAWANGQTAGRYRRALEAIAAFDPGTFRPLSDEIAIWKQAKDALQGDATLPTLTHIGTASSPEEAYGVAPTRG